MPLLSSDMDLLELEIQVSLVLGGLYPLPNLCHFIYVFLYVSSTLSESLSVY